MKICPVCLEPTLVTDDVNQATHVALGFAVCSTQCHQDAYDLEHHEVKQERITIVHDIGPP